MTRKPILERIHEATYTAVLKKCGEPEKALEAAQMAVDEHVRSVECADKLLAVIWENQNG